MHLRIKIEEKFKLKTKLTKTKLQKSILYKLCEIFSATKRRLNFQNPSTGSGDITSGANHTFYKWIIYTGSSCNVLRKSRK